MHAHEFGPPRLSLAVGCFSLCSTIVMAAVAQMVAIPKSVWLTYAALLVCTHIGAAVLGYRLRGRNLAR
jgi:hypothetical protein